MYDNIIRVKNNIISIKWKFYILQNNKQRSTFDRRTINQYLVGVDSHGFSTRRESRESRRKTPLGVFGDFLFAFQEGGRGALQDGPSWLVVCGCAAAQQGGHDLRPSIVIQQRKIPRGGRAENRHVQLPAYQAIVHQLYLKRPCTIDYKKNS